MNTLTIFERRRLFHFGRSVSCLLVTLLSGCFVSAASPASPELERLEAEIAPYVIPAEKNFPIPSVTYNHITLVQFAADMAEHGIDVLLPDPPPDKIIHLHFRELTPNRILDLVTTVIKVHWLYDEGRVIIFSSPQDLTASFQEKYAEKSKLQRAISEEQKRLNAIAREQLKRDLELLKIPHFTAQNIGLRPVVALLAKHAAEQPNTGMQLDIRPLVPRNEYQEKYSYNFTDASVATILDAIRGNYGLKLHYGPGNRIILR